MDSINSTHNPSLRYVLFACLLPVLVLPGIYWFESLGDINIYLNYETPPGQILYLFSKLAGMYALVLIWLQVTLALLNQSMLGIHLVFWNVGFHRKLGLSAALTVAIHAALFVAGVSIRKSEFAFGLLLPNFTHGFYAFSVTIGVFAVYLIISVVITGLLKKKKSTRLLWIHRLAVIAFIFAFIHSLLIGTETRFSAMTFTYLIMGITLLFALYMRFYKPATGFQTPLSEKQHTPQSL